MLIFYIYCTHIFSYYLLLSFIILLLYFVIFDTYCVFVIIWHRTIFNNFDLNKSTTYQLYQMIYITEIYNNVTSEYIHSENDVFPYKYIICGHITESNMCSGCGGNAIRGFLYFPIHNKIMEFNMWETGSYPFCEKYNMDDTYIENLTDEQIEARIMSDECLGYSSTNVFTPEEVYKLTTNNKSISFSDISLNKEDIDYELVSDLYRRYEHWYNNVYIVNIKK